MPHNLAGQIILEDMFSAPLSSLARLSQQAETALRQMGGTADTAAGTAAQKLQTLESTLDALKQKAQSGGTMTVLDVNQFRKLSREADTLRNGLDQMKESGRGVVQTLADMAGINLGPLAGGLTAAAAAFVAMKIATAGVELYKLGAQATRVENAFKNMAASVGSSSDEMLTALQRASRGTISDTDLMLAANRAMMLGVTSDAATMGRLLEVAIARGQAIGRSPLEAFNDIATGIGRMSGPILDNLGILTGGEQAFKAYAESIGRTSGVLTDMEKRQFLVNKVLADTTPLAKDAQMGIEQLGTAWANLKDELGSNVSELGLNLGITGALNRSTEIMKIGREMRDAFAGLQGVTLPVGTLEAWKASYTGIQILLQTRHVEDAAAQWARLREEIKNATTAGASPLGVAGGQWGSVNIAAPFQEATSAAIQFDHEIEQVKSSAMGLAGSLGGERAAEIFQQQEAGIRAYATWLGQVGISGDRAAFMLAEFTQKLIENNREMGAAKSTAETLAAALAAIGSAALGVAKSSALDLVGALGDTAALKVANDRAAAVENYIRLAHMMGKTNEQIEFGVRSLENSFKNENDAILASAKADDKKIASTNALKSALTGLESKIRSALSAGLEVTPGDMFATNAGAYQDTALESARRLNAIAQRGFEELKIHPDWASLLKIPPEVLSGSEEQLKAWASSTSASVQDLSRPDLINWDAFIGNFKSQLDKEQAQKLTLDIAVNKLDEAGLLAGLGGDEKARRDKVAEALGLKAPKITLEALLEADKNAGANLISSVYPPKGVATIPATYVSAQPGTTTTTQPPLTQTGTTTTGGALAGSIYSEFTTTIAGQNVGAAVYTAWNASLTAKQSLKDFGTIGTSLGETVAGAFVTAMKDGVGNVRKDIASIVAPEVAKILASQQPRTNLP